MDGDDELAQQPNEQEEPSPNRDDRASEPAAATDQPDPQDDLAEENERLRAEVAAANDAATAFDADVTALRDELERTDARLREATERYRDALLAAEPWLTSDLLEGGTIDEIDASARRARSLAERLRADAAAQAQTVRVPAGAPPRAASDTSHMTPEQKIRYGLQQRAAP